MTRKKLTDERSNARRPKAAPVKKQAARTVAKPTQGVKRIWLVIWNGHFPHGRRFDTLAGAKIWARYINGKLYEAREVPHEA